MKNLKTAITATCDLGEKIEKALSDDGKISGAEALGIVSTSFLDVVKMIKNASEIKQEFKNADKGELVEFFKKELDLENDRVEAIIEKAVGLLASIDDLVKEFV